MREIQKFNRWLMTGVLMLGLVLPGQYVQADSVSTDVSEKVQEDFVVSDLSPLTSKVIVLDPGHCARHPGARGNGLKEEVVVMDIADACLEVLDDYGDVTVYMTREDGSCCVDLGLGDCLSSRNNYAKQLNADFLISMHINAGYLSGANVLAAYKSGYHDEIRVATQEFGKVALAKLRAIGITSRGFLLRKSENGTRYSNGKLADYYSIVRKGVVQRIPSVIIEHGYITSKSDCQKFFNTKAQRQKVGKADAKAIISYFGLNKPVIQGKFKQIDDGMYYVTDDGKKVTGWVKVDENWYYFDKETGRQVTGFLEIDDSLVYLTPGTGEMAVDWFDVDDNTYLAKGDGAIVRYEAYNDGIDTYLFSPAGKQLKKGFHTINGNNYYVNGKLQAQSGVVKVKGSYYGFDIETCQQLYGYQKLNGKYYYFDTETGAAKCRQIVKVENKSYYFGSKGERQTGWRKVKGKYYYFSKTTGAMQKNKWIGKYYVNSKGVRTKKK